MTEVVTSGPPKSLTKLPRIEGTMNILYVSGKHSPLPLKVGDAMAPLSMAEKYTHLMDWYLPPFMKNYILCLNISKEIELQEVTLKCPTSISLSLSLKKKKKEIQEKNEAGLDYF